MFAKFKLSNIQLGDVKIGTIEVEAKYKLDEVVGVYDLSKKAIKEMPEIMEDLKVAGLKFMEIDKELEELAIKDFKEEMAKKNEIMESFKSGMEDIIKKFRTPIEEDME